MKRDRRVLLWTAEILEAAVEGRHPVRRQRSLGVARSLLICPGDGARLAALPMWRLRELLGARPFAVHREYREQLERPQTPFWSCCRQSAEAPGQAVAAVAGARRNGARRCCLRRLAVGVSLRAYSRRGTPGMTAATTTPLQSKFGPIVADAAGTITVQEASDVLEWSRFRVCELLSPSAGRVLVADVLAVKSSVESKALEAAPAVKLVG
jgi:hypothetical protein